MESPATVNGAIDWALVGPEGHVLPIVASMHYSSNDPLAVETAFDVGSDDLVGWVFARDLLADGLYDRSGLGDVIVEPHTGDDGRVVVTLTLVSHDGTARLQAPAAQLQAFLESTYRVVPRGAESEYLDISGALASLLALD